MQKLLLTLLFAPMAFAFVASPQTATTSKTVVFAGENENQGGGIFGGMKKMFEELDAFGKRILCVSFDVVNSSE